MSTLWFGLRASARAGAYPTSVEDIAAAAGVTKRVLYDHFRSKRDLNIALLRANTRDLLSALAERAQLTTEPDTLLPDVVDAFFRFVEEHPFAWRMLFRDPPTDPIVADVHREVQQQATTVLADLLAANPALVARIPADRPEWLEMLAIQLKAGGNGLAGWWYEHPHVPRADVVVAFLDLVLVGLQALASHGTAAARPSTTADAASETPQRADPPRR